MVMHTHSLFTSLSLSISYCIYICWECIYMYIYRERETYITPTSVHSCYLPHVVFCILLTLCGVQEDLVEKIEDFDCSGISSWAKAGSHAAQCCLCMVYRLGFQCDWSGPSSPIQVGTLGLDCCIDLFVGIVDYAYDQVVSTKHVHFQQKSSSPTGGYPFQCFCISTYIYIYIYVCILPYV